MEVKALALLFLCISCSGMLALGYYTARFLESSGSRQFLGLMLAVFLYSFGYLLELTGRTYAEIYFALKIEYLGIPFVPVFWFLFALKYNNYRIKNKWWYVLLFAIPVATVAMVYTNELHHLYYARLGVDSSEAFPVASFDKGPWYYVRFYYETLLSLGGIGLFFRMTTKTQGYRKKQANIIFYASLIPWVGNICNLLLVNSPGIDTEPFYLSVVVPIFAYGMFRLRMFDVAPVARSKVFETMQNPVLVLDRDFLLVDFNNFAAMLFPELTREVVSLNVRTVLGEYPSFIETLPLAEEAPVEIELKFQGEVRHFSVSITQLYSTKKRHIGQIVLLYDVTENRRLVDKLQQLATIDTLTQVQSRRFFMESCIQELRWAARKKGKLSFLMIDIDHFKNVNDTYGHIAGDRVLKNVTDGFRSILRKSDIIGRYGGEEFTILLPNSDMTGAEKLSERLRAVIESTTTTFQGKDIRVTISIGISGVDFAEAPLESDLEKVFERLLEKADQALYKAKHEGRNRVCRC